MFLRGELESFLWDYAESAEVVQVTAGPACAQNGYAVPGKQASPGMTSVHANRGNPLLAGRHPRGWSAWCVQGCGWRNPAWGGETLVCDLNAAGALSRSHSGCRAIRTVYEPVQSRIFQI